MPISDAAAAFLELLIADYRCELANHAIGASHAVKHASGPEAMLALVTEAYQRGAADAVAPTLARVLTECEQDNAADRDVLLRLIREASPDFDADVAAVVAANAKGR